MKTKEEYEVCIGCGLPKYSRHHYRMAGHLSAVHRKEKIAELAELLLDIRELLKKKE